MDIDTFWSLIDSSHEHSGGDKDKQLEWIVETLSRLPETEIIAFDRIFWEMRGKAYRADLWDAGNFVYCFLSNDGFTDFRAWLISMGREVYEKVLEDPDNLADVINMDKWEDVKFELFGYAANYAYRDKTGEDMPYLPGEYQHIDSKLMGELHDEDELSSLFPRIMAKLGDCTTRWEQILNKPPDDE